MISGPDMANSSHHQLWSVPDEARDPAGEGAWGERDASRGTRPKGVSGERTDAGTPREGSAPSSREPLAELAERVGETALKCPDVLTLTAGPRGWIATYRAGPPFTGVAVRKAAIEVGVVVRYGRPFAEIAEDVRRLVRPLAGRRTVDVLIGDVADDG